ncbi:haloacid dehalogenase protein [Purpureocillium lilacinum]|nr:haloacid dehalogenase protein [Purpureocillium lilacinum]OAQ88886.1 haloacid dehalogenase protein [Purpureocillium lilacinum]PWI73524.1 hypothetical protein PCL_08800 [Purpureocillium lilacinum]GJN74006.1 hypothetical protein PLICBS_008090 [Purpureocillium lilacinum]GJN84520.1 hypothetical protein PLIIFM63780_008077 [Purpureocillium lilacinum]
MPESSAARDPDWRPKAIVFDLLTGLLDSWSLWDASTPSGTAAEGRPWRARYLKLTFEAGSYSPYEDFVRQAARDVGLPDSAPEALLRDWANLQPWPEAGETLRQLKENGYELGVVTNCSKQMGNLAASNVAKQVDPVAGQAFKAVVTAEESGFYKPVGKAYEAILEALGVKATEALFVAGSAGDVEGATAVGMKVVWHNKAGLERKGSAIALRESDTLNDALRNFI